MERNVVAFLNMKGGVCKTTLCKEMALYLSERKEKRILVIDIDPQANCTQSFFEKFKVVDKFKEKYKEKQSEEINDSEFQDIDIIKEDDFYGKLGIPSIQKLFTSDRRIIRSLKKEDVIYNLTERLHIIPGDLNTVFMERSPGGESEQKLVNFIKRENLRNDYDYILIDCPPTYSFYTVSAILASDFYLVPLVPDVYSVLGLDLLEKVVSDMKDIHSTHFEARKIDNLGVVFTKIPTTLKGSSGVLVRNKDGVKKVDKFKNIYFFENDFKRAAKMEVLKLDTFILDRDDSVLTQSLSHICDEFITRVGGYNAEDC